LHTAAVLNDKQGRFWLAIFLENGLVPNKDVVDLAMHKFNFLKVLDSSSIIFESDFTLQRFEQASQSAAI
jgi:hypothetical protein